MMLRIPFLVNLRLRRKRLLSSLRKKQLIRVRELEVAKHSKTYEVRALSSGLLLFRRILED